MITLYNILIFKTTVLLFFLKFFNKKIRVFVDQRKNVLSTLEKNISKSEKYIWIHVASLGEYEQGLPVFKELKKIYKDHKILLSFFSSSGYEVKKNNEIADLTVYLPLDNYFNSKKFIKIVSPKMAFFVKYEFWPNYLRNLSKNNIPTYLIAGRFRQSHWFFKWYGKSFLKMISSSFSHFFVQNKTSLELLKKFKISNSSLMGDSRFDRVYSLLNQNNFIKNISDFIDQKTCFVAGSTWFEDESLIIDYLKSNSTENIRWIIAPHQINSKKIKEFQNRLNVKSVTLSNLENNNPKDYKILIVDCIGLLTKLYSYANISYVGGAMGKTGLHNILEPAIFKCPIVIGKNHDKFPEAQEMINLKGLISVKNSLDFNNVVNKLINDKELCLKMGENNYNYIFENLGATKNVVSFLKQNK